MSWENNLLTTAEAVTGVIGSAPAVIMKKQLGALDDGCVEVLARSPVAGFGYLGVDGSWRTTYVGGVPGFARVHSPTRISFALCEEADGPASLVFLLPGVGETLRVNGTVRRGRLDIEQVYVHCAQAVLRSGLWQPPGKPAVATVAGEGPLGSPGVADFLAASPFLVLSTWDAEGGSDTSPRGDQGAVARIVDGRTLLIADRRGNKRADTLHNLLQDDRISFAALVPGRTGVLHVRGRAVITVDPALLEPLALRGIPPHAALLVDVEAAELSANDAVTRARLWTAATPEGVPDLMALASLHLAANSRNRLLVKLAELMPKRLMRAAMNLAYRSGLRKEGFDVAAPAPRRAVREPWHEVRVVEVREETPSAVTLVLEGDRPFDFRPGQFFTLVTEIDGTPVRRPYSASSAPGTTRLEVTVKQVEGGLFSHHVRTLTAGDRLSVRGPSGTFHAEPGHEVALIAAGSGITPMMSIARTLLARPGERVSLLYSTRTEADTIFAADLARLVAEHPGRFTLKHVLTSRDGRLDAPAVQRWAADLGPDAKYYLCGPEALMDIAVKALDLPDERVHVESYTSASTATGSPAPQRMRVESGGRPVGEAVVEPGQTLLDAGLAAGLPMPYSCTVGSCHECVAKLLKGRVSRDDDGEVLTCTSAPLTDVTLELGTTG
ncbi:FAD-binding oxidoreductase [Lentzea sp. CA-135723]|uniref:FAD-binding oxidoreductase n=1 Tax=Lentzea sp. CA-135723 TaxID=3239950 RepID=UPI003D8C09B5